jgi:hypothetical protein
MVYSNAQLRKGAGSRSENVERVRSGECKYLGFVVQVQSDLLHFLCTVRYIELPRHHPLLRAGATVCLVCIMFA